MNLLKKFVRNDSADFEEDYEDIYAIPEDIKMEMSEVEPAAAMSAMDSPERKEPEIHPVSADKVTLKLLQPKTHTEAAQIAGDAQVKELWLTHYSPAEQNAEIHAERVREIFANTHKDEIRPMFGPSGDSIGHKRP
mgnify:CR=1 FL=1